MGDVEFKIEDLEFNHDPETIIAMKIQKDFMIELWKILSMMIIKVFYIALFSYALFLFRSRFS